jgi:hypothetical protein
MCAVQQVPYDQGCMMLRIFANYHAKSSILADFGFYDEREASGKKDEKPGAPSSSKPGDAKPRAATA